MANQKTQYKNTIESIYGRLVLEENGCMAWTGKLSKAGYGYVCFEGKAWLVHRLVYLKLVGEIPDRYEIHHKCNNPRCARIEHLSAISKEEHLKTRYFRRQFGKSACPKGHPYEGDNLYVDPDGARRCRECHKERCLRDRLKKRLRPLSKKRLEILQTTIQIARAAKKQQGKVERQSNLSQRQSEVQP